MPSYSSINLHPSSHLLSALKTHVYDVICIGSGWAGRIIAARIVKAGRTAIIIEQELVGGDCPFWACVPSKALLRPKEALDAARAVSGTKEKITEGGVNVGKVFERRDRYAGNFDDGVALVPMVESSGAVLVRGTGKIVGEKMVKVETLDGESVTIEARLAVAICTGSEPFIPETVRNANPWTPRHATSASIAPEHLVIMGAGAVGTEMATAYSGFGAKVTLISSTEEILPKIDTEGARIVRKKLIGDGVDVILSTKVVAASRNSDTSVTVELSNGNTIIANELLVAAGRRALTMDIGLDQLGLKSDGSPLPVDESLRVKLPSNQWLYAGGDVNGRAQLTHSSKYHGRIVANSILNNISSAPTANSKDPWGPLVATADHRAQPAVIFTSPTVATVGLTKKTASVAGVNFREITAPARTLGAMLHEEGYESGWAQWIVDEDSNKLLGATFVGNGVADLLHASTVAIVGGLTLEQLSHAIPSFPTMSEVYLNLLEAAGI